MPPRASERGRFSASSIRTGGYARQVGGFVLEGMDRAAVSVLAGGVPASASSATWSVYHYLPAWAAFLTPLFPFPGRSLRERVRHNCFQY